MEWTGSHSQFTYGLSTTLFCIFRYLYYKCTNTYNIVHNQYNWWTL